eukprot:85418-Pyramimonas_sp.AAC.1
MRARPGVPEVHDQGNQLAADGREGSMPRGRRRDHREGPGREGRGQPPGWSAVHRDCQGQGRPDRHGEPPSDRLRGC